jgi:hypothetical protein
MYEISQHPDKEHVLHGHAIAKFAATPRLPHN